ncbi:MAG: hypothetical protein IPM29_23255 [Planctomycetes bacterium]|nr:hypothetical protein [Planctomycetota bacterium]
MALTRCTLDGVQGGAALDVRNARVWFAEGTCRGAAELLPFFLDPGVAVSITSGQLCVAGDAATVIAAGTATSTNPVPAIVGTSSTVTVDVHVTLQSHAGAPPLSGTVTLSIGRLPSIRAEQTSATQLDLRLHAPGALRGHALLGPLPAQPIPLGALGDLWVELANLVLDGGNVPANGVRTATFPLPALPPGLPVMVQGLVVYPSGPQLSAPAPLTLGL